VTPPNVIAFGSDGPFAALTGGVATLAFAKPSRGRLAGALDLYGPWFIAVGVWLTLWELTTAKPGFAGVALGWSKSFAYWGMPILKLIGPAPATAWIAVTFYFFPTTLGVSVFIVALASGILVTILTSSGVASVDSASYDVGRNLGVRPWHLVARIALPSALPHRFVGLFMGLYSSVAVLVVAEMLDSKYGPGWYIQFQTHYSGYANVYATIVIMALLCAGLVKLLFLARERRLGWQRGFI
jgi:NitT/TauT family transport system permease protein